MDVGFGAGGYSSIAVDLGEIFYMIASVNKSRSDSKIKSGFLWIYVLNYRGKPVDWPDTVKPSWNNV